MDLEASPSFLNHPSSNTFLREFLASFSSVESGTAHVLGYVLFSKPSATETDPPLVCSTRPQLYRENSILGVQQWGRGLFHRPEDGIGLGPILGVQQWGRGLFHPLDDALSTAGFESHLTCRGSLKGNLRSGAKGSLLAHSP